eukprot:763637-Hanusia_phi.AAC.3
MRAGKEGNSRGGSRGREGGRERKEGKGGRGEEGNGAGIGPSTCPEETWLTDSSSSPPAASSHMVEQDKSPLTLTSPDKSPSDFQDEAAANFFLAYHVQSYIPPPPPPPPPPRPPPPPLALPPFPSLPLPPYRTRTSTRSIALFTPPHLLPPRSLSLGSCHHGHRS